jgi:16S rRNA processing protein RimM
MTRVCVGAIVGVHGVKGAVRVKSFTAEAADIGRYGPVEDEATGRRLGLKVIGQAKGLVIARLTGVEDRDAAEALKGVRLTVPRESLPETAEDEFLYADLVGCRAETPDGAELGVVRGVFDFGAGEVLDVQGATGGLMVPFTRAAVPVVDVAGKRLVVDPPVWAPEDEEDGASSGE